MATEFICGVQWRAPVYIRIGHGSSEAIGGASEALDYLISRWPYERGRHYSAAMRHCKDAAYGNVPAEVAREAFISAAIEAYILA